MRRIRAIYVYKFFDDFVMVYPLYAVMFAERGLSVARVSVLFFVWSATALALEVPSGVLADRYDRGRVLQGAHCARCMGFLVWLLYPHFVGFLAGMVLWGCKSALTSGTFEAWVYDHLAAVRRVADYTLVVGRARAVSQLGAVTAGLGAAVAINFGYRTVLLLSILAGGIAAGAIALFPRDSRAARSESTPPRAFGVAIAIIMHDPRMLGLLLFSALTVSCSAVDEYWPLLWRDSATSPARLALFITITSGAQILGASLAHCFVTARPRHLCLAFAAIGLLLALVPVVSRVGGVLFLVAFGFTVRVLENVLDGWLQARAAAAGRATLSSIRGFFTELGVLGLYAGVGTAASTIPLGVAMVCLGAIIATLGLLSYLLCTGLAPLGAPVADSSAG